MVGETCAEVPSRYLDAQAPQSASTRRHLGHGIRKFGRNALHLSQVARAQNGLLRAEMVLLFLTNPNRSVLVHLQGATALLEALVEGNRP